MVDEPEEFETTDNQGSTVVHGGGGGTTYDTITTSGVDVPKTNTKRISGYLIRVGAIPPTRKISVSYDGGTTFQTFKKGDFMSGNLKGEQTSLKVKTDSGTISPTLVEFVFNFEADS